MNILLTGGTGYIGSHTAVVLAQAGHDVVLYDNLSNSDRRVVEHLVHITGRPMTFVEGDIRDTELLTRTLRAAGIEAVIHFAGLKAVGESVDKPVEYYANNVQGTISLLQAMQAVSIGTLVFSSSATVYGEPQYLPLDEKHPTSATNPYGRSKLHIEEMLLDVAKSDQRWRIACLRYFNPVGAHDSALIGESPRGIPNNLMPYIAQVAWFVLLSMSAASPCLTRSRHVGLVTWRSVMQRPTRPLGNWAGRPSWVWKTCAAAHGNSSVRANPGPLADLRHRSLNETSSRQFDTIDKGFVPSEKRCCPLG